MKCKKMGTYGGIDKDVNLASIKMKFSCQVLEIAFHILRKAVVLTSKHLSDIYIIEVIEVHKYLYIVKKITYFNFVSEVFLHKINTSDVTYNKVAPTKIQCGNDVARWKGILLLLYKVLKR